MSTTPVLIPVEEYLRTVYRPDCDYIDGEVLERNMGETPHARLQMFFADTSRLMKTSGTSTPFLSSAFRSGLIVSGFPT